MRQLTALGKALDGYDFSKLPMRQLTQFTVTLAKEDFSKLPMRQLTRAKADGR